MLRTLILLSAIAVAPVWAQDDLPEAPGKPVTARICTGCHGAEMFAGYHKSADDWDRTITTMTEKGLSISDADYTAVLDYLSKNLGPLPPKVNINKAAAADLARVLGITTAQAEAIVAYRTKNGRYRREESVHRFLSEPCGADAVD